MRNIENNIFHKGLSIVKNTQVYHRGVAQRIRCATPLFLMKFQRIYCICTILSQVWQKVYFTPHLISLCNKGLRTVKTLCRAYEGGSAMQEQMLLLIAKQLEEIMKILGKQKNKESVGKMGRPTKEHVVLRYRANYPVSKKMECKRATGLSIKTVSKYWDLYTDVEKEKDGEDEKM